MNHWSKHRLIRLGILAAIIHSILLFVVIPKFSSRLAPSYNQDRYADGYDALATNLVAGNGYRFDPDTARTLMREPGYPILLAGLFLTFGNSFAGVKILNMILALATAWLMVRIASKLSSNHWPTLAPPLLFLFHPGTLIAESRGGIEIAFALLITLFLLTIYKAVENNRWQDYVLSGVVLGITVSVRSVPMFFPFFLLVYLLLFEQRRFSILAICRNVALMIAAMLAVLSPWIIRNYSLTGKFIPTASVLGVSAHAGQYICMHLSEDKPWWVLDREAARERSQLAMKLGYPFKEGYYQIFYKTEDEIAFSKYLLARVVSQYEKTPALYVKCLVYNLFNFWFAGKTWISTTTNVVVQLPYLILAIVGAVLGLRNKQARIVGPLVLFVGYVMAVHVPILAQARYSVPLIPFLSLLASIALIAAQKRMAETWKASSMSAAVKVSGELTTGVDKPFSQGREM